MVNVIVAMQVHKINTGGVSMSEEQALCITMLILCAWAAVGLLIAHAVPWVISKFMDYKQMKAILHKQPSPKQKEVLWTRKYHESLTPTVVERLLEL